MRQWPAGSIDAVITDPPYSSGGFTRGDRTADTTAKYVQTGTLKQRLAFFGDTRSQWGWHYWTALWLSRCWQLVKDSGYILMFSDWRQVSVAMNAIEAGGFVLRGLVPWDKGLASRPPHTGYFRHQCEYVVWGTKGVSKPCGHGGPWPGYQNVAVKQEDKHHQTGKPTELLRRLVVVAPPAGVVFDPFCGSGTTCVAAAELGRRWIGCELSEEYCSVARRRVAGAVAGLRLSDGETTTKGLFA
jgi:site-specific DNA-methyltransferase (adenine-specific)